MYVSSMADGSVSSLLYSIQKSAFAAMDLSGVSPTHLERVVEARSTRPRKEGQKVHPRLAGGYWVDAWIA